MWSQKNWNGAGSPYSSPMNSIGVNGESSMQNAASAAHRRREPIAEGAVADLVVVLAKTTNCSGGRSPAGAPKRRAAEGRVVAVVDERTIERLRQIGDAAEVRVVAVALAGQQHEQCVVEVIGPLGVAAPAAERRRADHARVVEPGLGDHERARVGRVNAVARSRDDVRGARVVDRVNGVQPQAVDVKVADPAGRRSGAPTRARDRTARRRS